MKPATPTEQGGMNNVHIAFGDMSKKSSKKKGFSLVSKKQIYIHIIEFVIELI